VVRGQHLTESNVIYVISPPSSTQLSPPGSSMHAAGDLYRLAALHSCSYSCGDHTSGLCSLQSISRRGSSPRLRYLMPAGCKDAFISVELSQGFLKRLAVTRMSLPRLVPCVVDARARRASASGISTPG